MADVSMARETPLFPVPQLSTGAGVTHIFLHVQKTAGSSMRNALAGFYQPEQLALLYPAGLGMTFENFLVLPEAEREKFRLIVGHLFFGLHRAVPHGARYIAFLRTPRARIRSHVLQHMRFNSRFFHEGREIDIATAVNEGLTEEFDNLQLRLLTGSGTGKVALGCIGKTHMQQAVKNLITRFGFVGLVQEIESDWPRLLAYLGLPVTPLQHDNISPDIQDET